MRGGGGGRERGAACACVTCPVVPCGVQTQAAADDKRLSNVGKYMSRYFFGPRPTEELHPSLKQLQESIKKAEEQVGPATVHRFFLQNNDHIYSHIMLEDGRKISVQAQVDSSFYCSSYDGGITYSHLEIADLGEEPLKPYGCSAAELMELIASGGGVVQGQLPPLDFGIVHKGDNVDVGSKRKCVESSTVFRSSLRLQRENAMLQTKIEIGTRAMAKVYKGHFLNATKLTTGSVRGTGPVYGDETTTTSSLESETEKDGITVLETMNSLYTVDTDKYNTTTM